MSESLISVIPNLSIGVVAIGALVYVVKLFVDKLNEQSMQHGVSMNEREEALRAVEREIREELVGVLKESRDTMNESAKIMERVASELNRMVRDT